MKRPKITVTLTDFDGVMLHEETRSAFNAGVRASEAAVREHARSVGSAYQGATPRREGDVYSRTWTPCGPGAAILVRVAPTTT